MILNAAPLNTVPLNSGEFVYAPVLAAEHDTSWAYWPEAWHDTAWTFEIEVWHDTGWRGLTAIAAEHDTGWRFDNEIVAEHSTGWCLELALEHDTAWSTTTALALEHDTAWTFVSFVAAEHDTGWSAFDRTIEVWHDTSWAFVALTTVDEIAAPTLSVGGRNVGMVSATLSADESSPYWQAEIDLADARDYRLFERDAPFSVRWFGVSYSFVVDTRRLTRSIDGDGNLDHSASVSGLSPLCLLDEPRATPLTKTWDTPKLASDIVGEVLGTVTWDLVDWTIPANRLSVDHASPLAVAKQVVEAAGGLIESNPDGSIRCRHRWPVPATRLASGVTTALADTTIYSITESPVNDDAVNRIRILDVEATLRDGLEWVQDESDWRYGMLRAYPSPWRDRLALRTTRGAPPIYLGAALAKLETRAPEIVEFRDGTGSVSHPIHALVSVTWLIESLGAVTFAPYSTELVAATKGYSLAEIVYTARYLEAPGHAEIETSAQFLLEETDG